MAVEVKQLLVKGTVLQERAREPAPQPEPEADEEEILSQILRAWRAEQRDRDER